MDLHPTIGDQLDGFQNVRQKMPETVQLPYDDVVAWLENAHQLLGTVSLQEGDYLARGIFILVAAAPLAVDGFSSLADQGFLDVA